MECPCGGPVGPAGGRERGSGGAQANNFAVVDLGDLATGSRLQQVGGPLGGLDLRLSAAGY